MTVTGIPNFAPELLRRVHLADASKTKQLAKALTDLAEEGVVQVFKPSLGAGYYVGRSGRCSSKSSPAALAEYAVPIRIEPTHMSPPAGCVSDEAQFENLPRSIGSTSPRTGMATRCSLPPASGNRPLRQGFPALGFMATKDRGEAA